MTALTEVQTRERIHALDILRGVAVAGILFANVLTFFGIFLMPPDQVAALPTAAADHVAAFLEHTLVDGKFYSVFSLLFGVGFGLQLARSGEAALPRFRRRLRVLLGIGAVHALLIWGGDILMLYALLGFTLPWFAKKSDRSLLRWTVALLATPAVLYVLAVVILGGAAPASANASADPLPPAIREIFSATGTGGVVDAFVSNLVFLVGRWAELFATVRFPKVLGMFLLGLWVVRSGLAQDPASHRKTVMRWCMLGWAIGLPANLLYTWTADRWAYLPPTWGGLLGTVAAVVGVPLLALGYATTVTLLVVDGRRVLNIFGPVGRMALTNYLMHSVICIILSRGFGFGLWWRVGASTAMAIALAIIVVQIPLSAWWLSRHRFGPAEWIWRRLTYGVPI